MKELTVKGLPQLAIAANATTPVPADGPGWAWSTTLSRPVYWDGSNWIDSAASGTQNVFVQPTQPSAGQLGTGHPGLWIQTGLGASGSDMTFWVEDGV